MNILCHFKKIFFFLVNSYQFLTDSFGVSKFNYYVIVNNRHLFYWCGFLFHKVLFWGCVFGSVLLD